MKTKPKGSLVTPLVDKIYWRHLVLNGCFEIKIMVKSNAMFILDISQTRQQARLSNAKVVRALITVVFQPTLNTIMRAWVYMTFFIIQIYFLA